MATRATSDTVASLELLVPDIRGDATKYDGRTHVAGEGDDD